MILFKQKQSNKSSEFKKGEVLFLKKAREMIHQAERGKHRATIPRSRASCAYRKISIRKYDHRLWHMKKNTATQSWTIGHHIFLQTCLFFFFCLLGEKNFDPIFLNVFFSGHKHLSFLLSFGKVPKILDFSRFQPHFLYHASNKIWHMDRMGSCSCSNARKTNLFVAGTNA